MTRLVVLLNGGAGSLDGEAMDDEVERVRAAFVAAGAEVEVRAVEPADLADEARRAGEVPGVDAVVVGGGDGTVGGVARALADTEVVLGVLPLGTFNHFAKDLGIPTDLDDAARTLASSEVRTVDVGEVGDRAFVNNAVLGIYPDLVRVRDALRDRHGWGKVRAVPVAALDVLRRFPVHRLELHGEGIELGIVRTPLVFVGCGVYDTGDGGAPARARLDEGALGVTVARTLGRWALVRGVLRSLVRGTDASAEVETRSVAEVTVRARVPRLQVALDGEVCELPTPLRFRVRPGALRVLAPSG